MIKILFVMNYIKNGGPSRVVLNIINNLDKSKYEVNILTLKDKNDNKIVELLYNQNVNVIQLNYSKNSSVIVNIHKIRRIIKQLNIDIAHSHGLLPDIIISKGKYKRIATLHSILEEDYIDFYGKKYGQLLCKIHEKYLNKLDLVSCCSESVYNAMKKKIKKINFVRNGIDFDYPEENKKIRNKLNIPLDAIVYIYSGRLVTRKRILQLLDLFNKYKKENEYLLVLGTGPLYDEVIKYDSEQIRILGFKSNIYDYYAISNVYVSNSFSEVFSISIIEALGCGLHLLISENVSHLECFNIDKNYYIGEHFCENTFESKKEALINRIKSQSNNSLKQFQREYLSGKSMTAKYMIFYEKLLNKQSFK